MARRRSIPTATGPPRGDHRRVRTLKRLKSDPRAYNRTKHEVRERILDILEEHYVPGLREHIGRVGHQTPVEGLFLTGSAAEYPILGGSRLYSRLTGEVLDSHHQ